jgi:mono/diheme cytochrome c family protein
MLGRLSLALLGVALAAGFVTLASASEPALTIDIGGTARRFTREELLRNPSTVDIDVGRDTRARQTLFVTQCLVCHKLNGAGSADVGPDLNLPENPTEYFQASALVSGFCKQNSKCLRV